MINCSETTVICLAGFQPGSGKSTLINYLRNKFEEKGFTTSIECADDYRNEICPKSEFERSFEYSIRCGEYDIVFYDKNNQK